MAAGVSPTAIIARSIVKPAKEYPAYREYLRFDFWFSCAYCTVTELEAGGLGFSIDHYEPKSVRSDLIADYANLLWSCDLCNSHKGDDCPTAAERAAGLRYFRPDEDDAYAHFEIAGIRINPKSKVGEFTIEMLYLNRLALRHVRALRQEWTEADRQILVGLRALRDISIDRLGPAVRRRFLNIRNSFEESAEGVAFTDEMLRSFGRSPFVDRDPRGAREQAKRRRDFLARERALLPPDYKAD